VRNVKSSAFFLNNFAVILKSIIFVQQLKLKIMKDLFKKCPECDASGYVTVDINDTDIPYEQNEIDYTCMVCDGTGGVVDKDELLEKIDQVNDLIQGMQVRMRCHSDTIKHCKKGMLDQLAEKYVYKLEICSLALGRLMNYKRKLYNLVA
jgi:hypothetical protein